MYNYETERHEVFTENGQVMFLKLRDRIDALLAKAGAVRLQEAMAEITGPGWTILACVDRMIELGEIREITDASVAGQYRVFIR